MSGVFAPLTERVYSHTFRRRAGLALGMLVGLAFALSAQWGNPLVMPGINHYLPPFGIWGNTLLCVVVGGFLGAVGTWPTSSLLGIGWGSLAAAVVVQIGLSLSGRTPAGLEASKLVGIVSLFLPIFGAMLPLLALFRWVVNQFEEANQDKTWTVWVFIPAVFIALMAFGLGAINIVPERGQDVLKNFNTLIQSAQQAADDSSLPAPLVNRYLVEVRQRIPGSYTLQWDDNVRNRYAIPFSAAYISTQSIGIARFNSGWTLICMYPMPSIDPDCRFYWAENDASTTPQ